MFSSTHQTRVSRDSQGIGTSSRGKVSQQKKSKQSSRGSQRATVDDRCGKSKSKGKETIDPITKVRDDDSETPELSDLGLPRSSRDNSDDDNDSKSDDGSDDHDSQGGGGGKAYGISPFAEEAYFSHAIQDQDHGARPSFRYHDEELLAYRRRGRRIVAGRGTHTSDILDHFHEKLRITEERRRQAYLQFMAWMEQEALRSRFEYEQVRSSSSSTRTGFVGASDNQSAYYDSSLSTNDSDIHSQWSYPEEYSHM